MLAVHMLIDIEFQSRMAWCRIIAQLRDPLASVYSLIFKI